MGINIRTKGAAAEREVATALNNVVIESRKMLGLSEYDKQDLPFQRNQNQSAVGGDDLTNPFNLSIEVKRQEQLSINTWWKQTVASAERTGGIPILIYKQNHKKWKCVMNAEIPIKNGQRVIARVEISMEDFLLWFGHYYGGCV